MTDAAYRDDELVYVDPETRTVVGRVEWNKDGMKPKSRTYSPPVAPPKASGQQEASTTLRRLWRKYFPWGTYRSMKRVYRLEGKGKAAEPQRELEDVLPRALSDAYWD